MSCDERRGTLRRVTQSRMGCRFRCINYPVSGIRAMFCQEGPNFLLVINGLDPAGVLNWNVLLEGAIAI